jgi:hypothetical protein
MNEEMAKQEERRWSGKGGLNKTQTLPSYNGTLIVTFTVREQAVFHHPIWRDKISYIIHHK